MLKPLLALAAVVPLTACEVRIADSPDQEPRRPSYELTTTEAYDLEAISSYTLDHAAVYNYIDARLPDHLVAIQRWLRQPSISAQDVGVKDMAELLRQDLLDLGFAEANLVPTDGHPGVWGFYDAGADKTLAVYLMYDVQPVNPDDW